MKKLYTKDLENKTKLSLVKPNATIVKTSLLRDYLYALNVEIFEDKELFLKQKPYAIKNALKEIKSQKFVDEKMVYSINLMIRAINEMIKVMKEEKEGKNFIISKDYKAIIDTIIFLNTSSSMSKILLNSFKSKK